MSTEPTPSQPAATPPTAKVAWGKMLALAVALTLIAGGVYAYFYFDSQKSIVRDNSGMLKSFIIKFKSDIALNDEFTDADQDGVADTPTDPMKLQTPAELNFLVIAGDNHAKNAEMWQPFLDSLSKKLGKPVKYLVEYPWPVFGPGNVPQDPLIGPVGSYDQQLQLFSEGKLHICAFSTGQVPIVVSSLGFVPLVCAADEAGKYSYEMEIIVPKESPIQSMTDLKGRELTLTSLSSNAGGRVPLVVLKEEFGLMQSRDYGFRISGDYINSVLGVCLGMDAANQYRIAKTDEERAAALTMGSPGVKIEAAAVASDILERYIQEGIIKPDQYRTIYKSKSFPPLCFGVRNDLDPKLREAILETFLEYQIAGSPLETRYPKRTRFAKVDFLKDWAYVREMDEKLTRLLDK